MELNEITIAELQSKMASGELSSQSAVEKYLARIEEIDPKIHSIIELNPDARAIAAQMDAERQSGQIRGLLHGVPILLKDNIDTLDNMESTAGSLALLGGPKPQQDAFLVERLRAAGAVILGKTNLSEWANFRSTNSLSGWSGRGGQTNNPYVLDQNPCGSSSGTGAAISANLAAVGVGTETNGSIICPAVKCGLVGIKPTLGLISRSGIIPIAHSQDTAGPMARTVSDAAILLGAMVSHDKNDPITSQSIHGHQDYTQFLLKDALQGARLGGARLGVARQYFGEGTEANALRESHLRVLEDEGAILIDVAFPTVEGLWDDELEVLLTEFKAGLNDYLAARNAPVKTLAELIRFNEQHKTLEMPLFEQELFLQAEQKEDLSNEKYRLALQRLKLATQAQGIDAIMTKDRLDAIVSPTAGATWSLAAIAGYPYITVPAGFSDGLPVGLAFFGSAFIEPQLIKFAFAFEQKTKLRQEPQFLSTLSNS
jgi:amidase